MTSPVSGDVRTFEPILNVIHADLKEIKLLTEEESNMKGTWNIDQIRVICNNLKRNSGERK